MISSFRSALSFFYQLRFMWGKRKERAHLEDHDVDEMVWLLIQKYKTEWIPVAVLSTVRSTEDCDAEQYNGLHIWNGMSKLIFCA
jgi:hypothetical protein